MKLLRRNSLIAALLLAEALIGISLAGGCSRNVSTQDVTPSDAMPFTAQLLAQTLPDVHGVMQPLRQWQGKLLVVNFWATWCSPCREEMPEFSRLQSKHAAKGVQFVGIALDSADKVTDFSRQRPVVYPLLIASHTTMPIMKGLGNTPAGLPFTVIIDRHGKLVRSWLGPWNAVELEAVLTSLAQPPRD
jgi:thiol-disulfide isomerase/thioredoxin